MPGLSVSLNGEPLVSVASDDLDLIDVIVSGDRLGPERATLRVSGGSFREDSERRYLIWVDERELSIDDRVDVTFHARGTTSQPGRTIEELYPDESAKPSPPFEPVEAVIRELAQRSKAFDQLAFRLVAPDGSVKEGCTNPEEHGFGFSVSWVSHRPGRARVSLHTYSLQSLAEKQVANYHAQLELHDGQGVTFNVGV